MDQIIELLKNTKFTIDFNTEDLDYIASNCNVLYLDKDKPVVKMGQYSPNIFIICEGQVKIFLDADLELDNNSGFITFLSPGEIIGEMEIYEDRENIANAYTVVKSTIISISKHLFKKRLLENSELNFSIMKSILSKWKRNEHLYLSLIQKYENLIIENREQQQKLDYERNLKEKFIINISHELRTPLTVIQGILDSPNITSDKIYFPLNLYDKLYRSNRFLMDLVNDLLDFTLLTEASFTLKPEWYQFTLIGDRIKDLNDLVLKKGLKLTYTIQDASNNDNSLFLLIDMKRINQIIINLISNSIKFTEKGEINVQIQTKDFKENKCKLMISVKDTGKGISSDDKEKIFDKFVRIQKKYESIEGTGLGLSIVKTLVTLMKGTIAVNSTLDIGSEFIVEIPVQYKNDLVYENKEENKIKLGNSNEIRNILIIDDFKDIHIVIKEMTRNLPIKIHSLYDGNSIDETILEEDLDIILIDLMLPSYDGYYVLGELKKFYIQNSNRKKPKFVAFTALANQNELKKINSEGFQGYLFKPFTKDELIEIIYSN